MLNECEEIPDGEWDKFLLLRIMCTVYCVYEIVSQKQFTCINNFLLGHFEEQKTQNDGTLYPHCNHEKKKKKRKKIAQKYVSLINVNIMNHEHSLPHIYYMQWNENMIIN